MAINFLGLNSGFDSGALVKQLVELEVQSRIQPLQTKLNTLKSDKTFFEAVDTDVRALKTLMNIDNLLDGSDTLFPRSVSSTDSDNEFITITADGTAAPQTFDIEVQQLATSTVRRSTANISAGITGATILDNIATKNAVEITDGTVTINGVTQTLAVDTAVDDVNDLITFFNSFAGVTASLNVNGHLDLTGLTSLGGAGDTSSLLNALGLDSAAITMGNASGLQNLDAMKPSSNLNTLGINGTNININGEDITFNPATDSITELITRINGNADTKVTAAYDSLNGQIVLTNDDTGAISLTLSSTDSNIITLFNLTAGETLGDNAEFTISTLNGGTTLISNSNTVEGLITGVTIDLEGLTSGPETITISQDKDAYREQIQDILDKTGAIVKKLEGKKDSFSRSFSQAIKSIISTYFSGATNSYKSAIEIGIAISLDGDNKFSGYTIDQDIFEDALDSDEGSLNALLFGQDGSSIDPLSDLSDGIFVQLRDLLDLYADPDVEANGILYSKEESLDTQITSTQDTMESRQASIDAYEKRLKAQYAALDTVSAQLQSQQSALSAFTGGG